MNKQLKQRERLEQNLIARFPKIKRFDPPNDLPLIESIKDGSFHKSSAGIALYCNGFTGKAFHPSPFGYLLSENGYFGQQTISFGIFRRGHDNRNYAVVMPLIGTGRLVPICSSLLELGEIAGVYVRFLKLRDYLEFVHIFKPAKEHPWDLNAPEEDETLCYSRIDLTNLRLNARTGYNRAKGFVDRHNLTLRFEKLNESGFDIAYDIIKRHFELLEKSGKRVGSAPEDYLGLLQPEILSLPAVTAVIGFLNDLPVSVFVSERTGQKSIAMFSTIVVRDMEYLMKELGITIEDEKSDGLSAIPSFMLLSFLKQLQDRGFEIVYLGGSEVADLNKAKIRLGAENDPTYWVVMLRD